MTSNSYTNLMGIIAQYSNKIKQKLTEYGYSRKEINDIMCHLVQEELRSCQLMNGQKSNQKQHVQKVKDESTFSSQINQKQKSDRDRIYHELLKIIRKLEVYYQEIQNLENNQQTPFSLNLDDSIKQKSTQGSQKQFTIKSIDSNSSFYRLEAYSKLSNDISAENDSFETQEIRLKTNLRNMIQKTRLLKAMIQNSIFMTSLREMESFGDNVPYMQLEGFSS